MSDDWLDVTGPSTAVLVVDEEKPADESAPNLSLRSIAAGADALERRNKFMSDWASFTDQQRIFLNTWRECRFNANKTLRVLRGTQYAMSKSTIRNWLGNPAFEEVRDLMRSAAVTEILNRDYLAARHEDVVETLLTPKPILHQGFATGYFEVEAAAAGKANETLLKLGGHLKDKDVEVNVGLVGPSLNIQVVMPNGEVKDVAPRGVTIELPAPSEDMNWLDGP